jgi:hypothetical protein
VRVDLENVSNGFCGSAVWVRDKVGTVVGAATWRQGSIVVVDACRA